MAVRPEKFRSMCAFWERREKSEKGINVRYSMKHKAPTKQLVTMLAVMAGLALAGSTQAQYVTGGQYLSTDAVYGGGYGDWASVTPIYTPTGIEIQAPSTSY